ncbi:MAG TPA: hypothetical protein VGG64_29905 [Pirellulales bacterium]|jgi:hypothetical protein
MATHVATQQLVTPSGTLRYDKTYTGDNGDEFDLAVADGTTNHQAVLAFAVATLVSIWLTTDQDLTIKTNSSGSPTNTIALKANVPYHWATDSYQSNLLTADVTSLFITNGSGEDANFSVRRLSSL